MDHDVISDKNKEKNVDSQGKIWRTPKSKIVKVAEIMNQASLKNLISYSKWAGITNLLIN